MAAADLLVGKPGGLTSSEALARGLALVVVHPIPAQEERNADHLLETAAAIRCNNLPALVWKIDRFARGPGAPDRHAGERPTPGSPAGCAGDRGDAAGHPACGLSRASRHLRVPGGPQAPTSIT
jgi:hypothetical protein